MYSDVIAEVIEATERDKTNLSYLKQVIQYLKDVKLISESIRVDEVKGSDGKISKLVFVGIEIKSIDDLKRILGSKLEGPSGMDKLYELEQSVKIGTEFTFCKSGLMYTMGDLETERNENVRTAGEYLQRYRDEILKVYSELSGEWKRELNQVELADAHLVKKKYASESYSAFKLRFKFYDKNAKKEEIWHVNFDLDPNCIELQTDPATYDFYQRHKFLINKMLFQTADIVGLVPEQNPDIGGGGHISLDYKTAFYANPMFLRNFLVLYDNKVRKKEDGDKLIQCEDKDNAPFMSEIGEFAAFKTLMQAYKAPDSRWENFISDMHTRVYTQLSNTLSRMRVPQEDSIHYQAVNLENVLNPTEALRRVEMRRFDAQRNVEELLKELDELFPLILDCGTIIPCLVEE